MEIILASASPRRRDLLEKYHIPFRVFVPDAEELNHGVDFRAVALSNAERKAAAEEREKAYLKGWLNGFCVGLAGGVIALATK